MAENDLFKMDPEKVEKIKTKLIADHGPHWWSELSELDRINVITNYYFIGTSTTFKDWQTPLKFPEPSKDLSTDYAVIYYNLFQLSTTLESLWREGLLAESKYMNFLAAISLVLWLRQDELLSPNYKAPQFISPTNCEEIK